ncbi:MAG: PD-(D/E)XK nuclease family protein [Lentisphaerae bacterium]|nr:PD-(D/E)XK nuclease family protein [Lentisphaerota bacterium]
MQPTRHFLGWDKPIPSVVRDFLLPETIAGPLDMTRYLVVVPTRQAGRRLTDGLALACAEQKTALFAPRVGTPSSFLRTVGRAQRLATPTETAAAWVDVLKETDPHALPALFPSPPPSTDFAWALPVATMIEALRKTLADGGYSICSILEEFGDRLEERQRWEDLAALETRYVQRTAQLHLADPCIHEISVAGEPHLPEGLERVVIACVPDPTRLFLTAVRNLPDSLPIEILVAAPEEAAGLFDEWGRPTSEWQSTAVEIPQPDRNIVLEGPPAAQALRVLEEIAAEAERFGPADIAVGVPDRNVVPHLETDLADAGLQPFDPAGKSLESHPVYGLIEAYRSLVSQRTYPALACFLRHPDILAWMEDGKAISSSGILQQLDEFQNKHLPSTLSDVFSLLPSRDQHDADASPTPPLSAAIDHVRRLLTAHREGEPADTVRKFLEEVYDSRTVEGDSPEDAEFIEAARLTDLALRELSSLHAHDLNIGKEESLQYLLRSLQAQRYYPERGSALIDLDGWLELHWSDAPLLILTGMNEGSVPGVRLSDVFLPDSLREVLGLKSDASLLARDTYILRSMIESRKESGRVCLVAGKTGSVGDPLKPSRLFFRCEDKDLPDRAKQLFGKTARRPATCPATVSFPLDPSPPPDLPRGSLSPSRFSVTAFRDYLACPFRYYLKRVLRMDSVDDTESEMDAATFGSLLHEALQSIPQAPGDVQRDPDALAEFLGAGLDSLARSEFGDNPTLPVLIQIEAGKQRLAAAARLETRLSAEGWETIQREMTCTATIAGVAVVAKIDRVDRHRGTGVTRILDYKTSDRAVKPEEAHMASAKEGTDDIGVFTIEGKRKRWKDLQLPLYSLLLARSSDESNGPFELGYITLPKAAVETAVTLWQEPDPSLIDAAKICATRIIEAIQNRVFWPPSDRVDYDDFSSLLSGAPDQCMNAGRFQKALSS